MTDSHRILIVDDEPLNVDYIQQELDDLGYETAIATDGKQALERVASDPPDLVLLDVMMPELDGITVCRMLKSDPETRLIPIVIMTALDAREDRIRGIEAGADDFLTKPVDDRELLARITTALKQKQTVDSALRELQSAGEQLERLGTRSLDGSVLVLELSFDGSAEPDTDAPDEALAFLARRYISAFEETIRAAGGEITSSSDSELTALFQSSEPQGHVDAALEAAAAIEARADAIAAEGEVPPLRLSGAVESGALEVGSARVERSSGPRWEISIDGDPARAAERLVGSGGEGIAVGDAARRRAGKEQRTETARSEVAPTVRGEAPTAQAEGMEGAGAAWWPEEFAGLEAAVRRAWDVEGEIYRIRSLGGKSGAHVAAVDLSCREFSGQAILKLAVAGDPSWGELEEAERHRRAVDANPEYAARHLPDVVHTLAHGDQIALLATIAGRGLEYSTPWAESTYGQQMASAHLLSRGLLEGFNGDYGLGEGLQAPAELLRAWLDYRLDPAEGRIHSFLHEAYGLGPDDASFIFEGHWYPNPLAFATEAVAPDDRLRLRALTGRIHGDLHGHNVLVRSPSADSITYYLIDLAMYEEASYLLYDHVYFELTHLLNARGELGPDRWLALLNAMWRDGTPDADDLGLVQLMAAGRQEVVDWARRHEPNRLPYVQSQAELARVAVGLSFVHKSLPAELRLLAFLYAAVALKGYLKFHAVDWPKHGSALDP